MANPHDQYLDLAGFEYAWQKAKNTFAPITQSIIEKEYIEDTVQRIVFDGNGNVQRVEHVRNNEVIRTDTFVFSDHSITETRTLPSGESFTIVVNTDTLETTVSHSGG